MSLSQSKQLNDASSRMPTAAGWLPGAVIHSSVSMALGSDGTGRRRIGERNLLELDRSGRDKADAHDPGGR